MPALLSQQKSIDVCIVLLPIAVIINSIPNQESDLLVIIKSLEEEVRDAIVH